MKRLWSNWLTQSFSTRLMIWLVLLVLATTLSAGLPAYWLASSQLEAQAWQRVENAQATTLVLLETAQSRLEDARLLFVERPTLRRLLLQNQHSELEEYITNFTRRSGIDLLLICDAEGLPVAGDRIVGSCPSQDVAQFTTIDSRPVLLVSGATAVPLALQSTQRVVVGLWLDDAFLHQLAATTGVEQSLLTPDGTQLATTLNAPRTASGGGSQAEATARPIAASATTYTYQAGTVPFFVRRAPMINSDGRVELFSEVALSVEVLQQTERRATGILLASTSIIALAGLFLGILYIRQLTTPLQKLTTAAEAIAVGRLSAPIPSFRAPHEVAILARALAASQQSLLAALGERSQTRDWLVALIQSVVEGVITLDSEGRITFFSQGAENLSGWSSQEVVGQLIDDVFPLAHAEDGMFHNAIPAPGQRRRLEVITRNGEVMALAITGTRLAPPVSNGAATTESQNTESQNTEPQGTEPQTALVVRDISGEEALDQMHSYFLANLTHEFQTPLSTLRASLELLMENAGELAPDDLRALLHPAHLSLLGLQNLVNNLLASSAFDVGRFTLRLRPTNLQQVIDDSLQLVQPLFERRRQTFTLGEATTVAAYPEIQADPARLTLALVNLLTNASKYSPDGATIDLALSEQGEWLRIAVADRGPGVPLAAHSQLFNRFVRLDAPESEQASTGLGLFVVKATAEAHGGRVGIDDRPGGGAIFWLEIPRIAGTTNENSSRRGRPRVIRHSGFHVTPRRLRGRSRL